MKRVFVFGILIITMGLFSELKAKVIFNQDSIISLVDPLKYKLDREEIIKPVLLLRLNDRLQKPDNTVYMPFQFSSDKKFHFLQIRFSGNHPKRRIMQITTGRANR